MRLSLGIPVLLLTTACGSGSLTLGDGPSKNCPGFGLSAEELVFDSALLVGPNELTLVVTNNCLDDEGDLVITAEVAGNDSFSVDLAEATMAPEEAVDLKVAYVPTGYVEDEGELIITTNIEDFPSFSVPLRAVVAADQDGDGFDAIEAGGDDCDDLDPRVNPGVAEVWYDGVDGDCDGADDFDQDGDGAQRQPEGSDCDDLNAEVNPGAAEEPDTLDNDCDGWVDEDQMRPGDILVSEIMNDPVSVFDTSGEWFEIVNRSEREINLVNWEVRDFNGDRFTIEGDLVVSPGQRAVFGVESDPARNGGIELDYEYPRESFDLENVSDAIGLQVAGEVVALVEYDSTWRQVPGRSLQLDREFEAPGSASVKDFWCLSSAAQAGEGSDLGTPGEANRLCPNVDHDGDGFSIVTGDCDDTDPSISPAALEVWNGIDDDCDGTTDVSDIADVESGYIEGDRQMLLGYASGLSTGDIDHDGDLELIVSTTRSGGTVDGVVYSLDAADASTWADPVEDVDEAKFTAAHSWDAMGLISRSMADNDGDGDADLVIAGSAGFGTGWQNATTIAMYADGSLSGRLDDEDATARWTGVRGNYDSNRIASHLDVNGDGTAEILFVDPLANTSDLLQAGAVLLIDAAGATGSQALSTAAEETYAGGRRYGRYGTSVDGGDINGDGYDEIVSCGQTTAFSNRGVCHIIDGAKEYTEGGAVDDVASVMIEGSSGAERLGFAHRVEIADFDGNAKPDLVIGSPFAGEALVFLDAADLDGSYDTGDADVTISPRTSPGFFGLGFAAGDFDGDGVDDLAVGAPDALYWTGADEAGQLWIWSGDEIAGGSRLSENDAWASAKGSAVGDIFGHAMMAADLEGDGVDDLIVTAPALTSNSGRISIILLD